MPAKVRLRKDVLKVGRWLTGYTPDGKPTFWTVTRETLDRLARNFASQLAAGYRHPLQWGHCANVPFGDAATAGITDIKRIWREADSLFAEFEVSPEVARTLTAMHRQVSVSVVPRWQTQAGKSWDESLTHIAIVDHGAVPGQDPLRSALSDEDSDAVDNRFQPTSLPAAFSKGSHCEHCHPRPRIQSPPGSRFPGNTGRSRTRRHPGILRDPAGPEGELDSSP